LGEERSPLGGHVSSRLRAVEPFGDEREEAVRLFEPHEVAAVLEHDVLRVGDSTSDSGQLLLQRDCALALSRGGRYTLDNIAPACGPCNTSKCNDEVTSWLRRKGFDERAFLLHNLEIQTALAVRFPAKPEGPETAVR
jgi:hypothetical protein